jgi:hypothetical protein
LFTHPFLDVTSQPLLHRGEVVFITRLQTKAALRDFPQGILFINGEDED